MTKDHSNNTEKQHSKVSLRQRICMVTWGWYTTSMSSGGIALLLYQTPHQFPGLHTLGKIVFIFNLVLFLSITLCLIVRFSSKRTALAESFQSPESYFVGTCGLAMATIIMGSSQYGSQYCGHWLTVTLRVIFWLYVAFSSLLALLQNMYIWHLQMGLKEHFALVRLLPFFPAMLSGTIATVLAQNETPTQAMPIIIGGLSMQGYGFLVSLFIYGEYFYNLSRSGLPNPSVRPEMFIAVGPVSFTAIALIGTATAAESKFPTHYVPQAKTVSTADVALVIAVFSSVFMWFLAFYFFSIAILALLAAYRSLHFSLAWWGCIFPNTGFILATIRIGTGLGSPAILWVSSAMTIVQVAAWLTLLGLTVWALVTRRMLWPSEKES